MMHRLTIATMFLVMACAMSAQDLVGDKAEQLFAQQSYRELIDLIGDDVKKNSAKTIYYVGMSYYMLGDDASCIEMMKLAIKQDKEYVDAYYACGTSLNYSGQPEDAISYFEKAIELDSTAAHFYGGMGDSYFLLDQIGPAIEYYRLATSLEDCPDRPYIMLPRLLLAQGRPDEALDEFYVAKRHIRVGSPEYNEALYNIGTIEFLDSNYTAAEQALTELLMLDPEDFEGYVTLIQLYHRQGRYTETDMMMEQLRKAYELELIPETIGDQYMVDHFNWESNTVIVSERFAQPQDLPYYKFHFKFFEEEEFQYSISLQRNLSSAGADDKYVLCKDQNGRHYEYELWFSESTSYGEVRTAVLEFLTKE